MAAVVPAEGAGAGRRAAVDIEAAAEVAEVGFAGAAVAVPVAEAAAVAGDGR